MATAYCGTLWARRRVVLRRPEGKAIFAPSGRLPWLGSTIRQPLLAATLEHIAAEGSAYAYRGVWAQQLAAAVRGAGGLMRREDLERYEARWVAPLTGTYLDFEIQV